MSPTDRSLTLGFALSLAGAILTLQTWRDLTGSRGRGGPKSDARKQCDPPVDCVPRAITLRSATRDRA